MRDIIGRSYTICIIFLGSFACFNLYWSFHISPSSGEGFHTFQQEAWSRHGPYNLSGSVEDQAIVPTKEFTPDIQMFVISMALDRVDTFRQRNSHSLSLQERKRYITWYPAINGYDQTTLNNFAKLSGFRPLNATKFEPGERRRRGYATPHHVGCFMSHWSLLRLAKSIWDSLKARPLALWIMEDDAVCATQTNDEAEQIISALPVDWDILFLGGKPFSYHHTDPLITRLATKKDIRHDFSRGEFREWACRGGFGRSTTGPFAPDGTRNLTLNQDYWKIKYITNTHSYILNPKRLEKVLHVLENPTREYQVPVDIALAEAGQRGELNMFMSPLEYCIQHKKDQIHQHPSTWKGLYYHKDLDGNRLDDIMFSECPSKL